LNLRDAARQTIIDRYGMQQHCMPALLRFVDAPIKQERSQ
jgi:hypothetical protein